MRKATLQDVARAAGVSYATADRVLNRRGGVAEKSALRVRRAIEDLGYERDLSAANLSRRRDYRFRFLLPAGDHSFFHVLRNAVEAEQTHRRSERLSIRIDSVPALDPEALAMALERLDPAECDALALVAIDTPRVTLALQALQTAGLPVVTLIGDAAPEAGASYVGIDNVRAGRTAGRLLQLAHRHSPGRLLPILGAMAARDHRERLEGAAGVLLSPEQPLNLLPAVSVQDRGDRMRDAVEAALARHPDITAIYSIGAGNRALIEILDRRAPPRPFVVVHDLTPATRAALASGRIDAVIDQKPARQVAVALERMRALADGRTLAALPEDLLSPSIYLRDNLPDTPEPSRAGAPSSGGPATE